MCVFGLTEPAEQVRHRGRLRPPRPLEPDPLGGRPAPLGRRRRRPDGHGPPLPPRGRPRRRPLRCGHDRVLPETERLSAVLTMFPLRGGGPTGTIKDPGREPSCGWDPSLGAKIFVRVRDESRIPDCLPWLTTTLSLPCAFYNTPKFALASKPPSAAVPNADLYTCACTLPLPQSLPLTPDPPLLSTPNFAGLPARDAPSLAVLNVRSGRTTDFLPERPQAFSNSDFEKATMT